MSKTVAQIYAINPTTVVADTDLYYLVQSPYTPGADAAITGASLKAAFGSGGTINPGLIDQIAYYAAAGTTLSGTSTIPTAVQANITTLGTIATGVWHGTVIGGTYGGTGVNNGASTITLGGSLTTSGAFASTFTMTNTTSVTFPTSGTLATTAQLLISPLTTKGDLWGYSTTNDRLPVGSTNGQVLQVNSSASVGLSYSTATYPTTASNAARILRADGTNWVQTTSTFADTYTASAVLYANGANNVAGLTTANNGLLVTSNTGVPSILAGPGTTGNLLLSNAAAAPSFTTFTYPTTVGASGSVHISNGTNIVSSTSLWPNTVGTSGKFIISDGTTNGYSTSTIPTSAGATANKVLLSDGTNYVLSTPTFPNASATSGKTIRSDGTNWIASTATLSDAPSTALKWLRSDGTNWITSTSTLSDTPSTAGKVMVSDGTNWITSTPTFPNASATSGKIIKSDGTNWTASTETYAAPGTSGNLMKSDGTNWTSATAAASVPTGAMFNLQQAQFTATTSLTSTSPTFADFGTNITVSITPTSASNKVLVRAVLSVGLGATSVGAFQLVRGSTPIGIGDAASNRNRVGTGDRTAAVAAMSPVVLEWLDSPATTSATAYKVQGCTADGTIMYLNRSTTDTDTNLFSRGVSVITAIEVKV